MNHSSNLEEKAVELGFGSASLMLRDRPFAAQSIEILREIKVLAIVGSSEPELIWDELSSDTKELIMAVAAMEASREIKLRG